MMPADAHDCKLEHRHSDRDMNKGTFWGGLAIGQLGFAGQSGKGLEQPGANGLQGAARSLTYGMHKGLGDNFTSALSVSKD